MRLWLKECQVGQAGPWRDWRLPPLTPGLNLLYGLNESGKTTLLFFIRAMLFGFDKTPLVFLDSSEPGGALTLADETGREWHLSRWGKGKKARVKLSGDGATASGEAPLQALLQHVSRPVFENVFAFSLSELADLRSLDQQGVRELLYSASLGLGRVSLAGAEAELKKQAEALFKPQGTKPAINQVLAELAQVRSGLRELERQPQEYQEILGELARLESGLRDITEEVRMAGMEQAWLRTLEQAWPVWESRHASLADLEVLPPTADFPEDGLERFEKLQAELERQRTEQAVRRENLGAARRAAAALAPDQALLAETAALEDLLAGGVLFEDRREQLARVELEVAQAAARLTESLASLGPGWDEARLLNFPLSLSWRQGVRDRQQRLEEAREAWRRAEAARRLAEEALREREAARSQATAEGLRGLAGWPFRWGLAALGGFLAVAAGLVAWFRLWYAAGVTGILAGALLLAALLFRLHLQGLQSRRLAAVEGERQGAAAALDRAQGQEKQEAAVLGQREAEWLDRLEEWRLPPDFSPPMVMELSREVEEARSRLQALQGKEQERSFLAAFVEEFTGRLNALGRRLGRPPLTPSAAAVALARLKQELHRHQEDQEQARRLAEEMARLDDQIIRGEEEIKGLEAHIRELWQAAGVDREGDFRRLARDHQRRLELEEQVRHRGSELRLLAGGEEHEEDLFRDLKRFTRGELEARLAEMGRRLDDLNHRLDQAKDQKSRLSQTRESLERTEELGQALLTEQTQAARLTGLARRWATLILARHFLEQGRRRFEAESQPQVLREAGRFFGELTEGRYRQVVATLEHNRLVAVNHQGRHLPAENLSRGAVEQLYLALRFALVQAYNRQGINLPLILDDILVNFDHRRARQAARLLGEMSATHQILLFTCHRHLLEMLTEVLGPSAPPPLMLEETH